MTPTPVNVAVLKLALLFAITAKPGLGFVIVTVRAIRGIARPAINTTKLRTSANRDSGRETSQQLSGLRLHSCCLASILQTISKYLVAEESTFPKQAISFQLIGPSENVPDRSLATILWKAETPVDHVVIISELLHGWWWKSYSDSTCYV